MPLTHETWLPEFIFNATTAGVQFGACVIQLANGNILVAWTSDNDTGAGSADGSDVIGQIFDPFGNAVGEEVPLNTTYIFDDERDVELTALPDGGFVAVCEDRDSATSLRLQEYDADGTGAEQARDRHSDTLF